jgi:probable phosphoglycerate mutase
MTRLYLIRHAATDLLAERIAGRLPAVPLSAAGREEAARLARRLAEREIRAIYSSPQQRARETARFVGDALTLPVQIVEEIDEIDYCDWTGRSFEELAADPQWQAFNRFRSRARIPNGEAMLEVQTRAVGFMERLESLHPAESIAVISHGDVIRAALAFYLGTALDFILRFEIGPASMSVIEIGEHAPIVRCINWSEQ